MSQSPGAHGMDERTPLESTGKGRSEGTAAFGRASAGREAVKAARAVLTLAAHHEESRGRHSLNVHGAVSARLPVARRRGGAQQVGRLAQRARVQAEEPAQLFSREGRRLACALGRALRTAAI